MTAGKPTLSVCCLTGEPPAQVAEMLELFRPVASEVLVAADSRIDPAELEPYRAVADRLVRYVFDQHATRAHPWLHAQCRSDWMFVIDGDEVPSAALTDALPDLLGRTDVMHYAFPRRWLFPDATHWLEELPWWPDFQVRLVRTGPTLRHTGHIHESVGPTYPMDHVDLPIYHLTLVTADVDERRERCARYEAVSPGRVAHGGGLLNEVIFLPEGKAAAPPSPVPPADLARISHLLDHRDRRATRASSAGPIPLVGRDEIDQHVTCADLAASEYRCSISPYAESGRIVPGEVRPVYVRIENSSTVTWHWGRDHQPVIGVGYHWIAPDGTRLPDDGRRGALPATLHPGGAVIVPILVEAPSRPGRYVLELDLVHDGVRWFGAPLRIDMRVAASANRGQFERQIPAGTVPAAGVNVIIGERSAGERGRALIAMLEQLDEPYTVIDETNTSPREEHPVRHRCAEPDELVINVVCVDSDQTRRLMEQLAPRMSSGHYTVGVWAWELEELPSEMRAATAYVDEIWTSGRHEARAIARAVDTPVRHLPLPVLGSSADAASGNPLGIDAEFTFLSCFDFHRVRERRNPIGVVRAFRQAFDPGAGPTLIITSTNGHSSLTYLERLRAEAGGRADIHIVDGHLDHGVMRSLIVACDCYVSLHQAEAFGSTMAEAMLAGKPVIATGCSGNLEFMNDDNSFLIRHEPDIDDAARLMRLVYRDPTVRERVGRRAHHDIATRHSIAACAPLLAARLADIRARASTDRLVLDERPSLGRLAWRATRRAGRLVMRS